MLDDSETILTFMLNNTWQFDAKMRLAVILIKVLILWIEFMVELLDIIMFFFSYWLGMYWNASGVLYFVRCLDIGVVLVKFCSLLLCDEWYL